MKQSQPPPGTTRARVVDSVILLAIVGMVLWLVLSPSASKVGDLVGRPAPQFKLRTVSGAVTGTPDHAGKVVLLDFWATWCGPCFKQMPIIQAVLDERPDVVLVSINVDDPSARRSAAIDKFIADAGLKADSLIDDGTVQAMYGVDTIPALVLIDPSGTIVYASSGIHTAKQLRERIDAVNEGTR